MFVAPHTATGITIKFTIGIIEHIDGIENGLQTTGIAEISV